jgi:hypothetical protein
MDDLNESLDNLFDHLPSTEREWKKHDALIDIGDGNSPAELGYMARIMVLCTLPHSDPGDDVQLFKRQNGKFRLYIQAGAETPLPYGTYPRLLFAWICREVIRTKERKLVLGDSLSAFMRELGLEVTGGRWGTIARFKEQVDRTLNARVSAIYEDVSEDGRQGRKCTKNAQVASKSDLWWKYDEPEQATFWKSTMEVGEKLYEEIIHHPVPFDMRVLKEIKQSPLAIDLYLWLTYRLSKMSEPLTIGWNSLHQQFGADYSQVKDFRTKSLKYMKEIQKGWPSLQFDTPRGRLKLYPTGPHIAKIDASK